MRSGIVGNIGDEKYHIIFMTSSIALLVCIDAVKVHAIKTRRNNGIEIAGDNMLPVGVPVMHPVVFSPVGIGGVKPGRSTLFPALLPIPAIGFSLPNAEIGDNTSRTRGTTQRVDLLASKGFPG